MLGLYLPVLAALDPTPEADDVTAGWLGAVVFIGLGIAVVILAISLTRHLKKTSHNAESGAFGPVGSDTSDETSSHRP